MRHTWPLLGPVLVMACLALLGTLAWMQHKLTQESTARRKAEQELALAEEACQVVLAAEALLK
mgnify:CR=1 FL=1